MQCGRVDYLERRAVSRIQHVQPEGMEPPKRSHKPMRTGRSLRAPVEDLDLNDTFKAQAQFPVDNQKAVAER